MQVSVRTIAAISVLACTVALGCADGGDGRGGGAADPQPPSGASPAADASTREHVVRASMRIRVDSIADAVAAARTALDEHQGYVEGSEADDERARLELRVPIDALGALRERLGELGHVVTSREDVQDVTLTHADQRARLVSAHAEEARLVEMFATRTDDLADVLAVERELSRVREQIERLDAEERTLRDRVASARLSVDLERDSPSFTSEPLAFLATSAATGADVAGALALATLGVVAALAPSVLGLLVLAWATRAMLRFLRARSIA